MRKIGDSLVLMCKRNDSRFVFIVSTLLFLFLLLLIQNGKATWSLFNFESLSLIRRISLGFLTLFDISNTFTVGALILAVLGSLLGGMNTALAYTYLRMRGEVIIHSGLYHGTGLFLAFLGIGCAACGTAFLSVILGFFGLSAMLQMLPYEGQEIGYAGLILLSFATYTLAQKVSSPNVC
jgi:hypothetical protein